MFPSLQRRSGTTLRLPELSGGVNFAAPADAIEDNQLSYSENLWSRGGALRQRPGLKMLESAFRALGRSATIGDYNTVRRLPVDYSRVYDKTTYRLRLTEIQASLSYQLDATLISEAGDLVALPYLQKTPTDPNETRRAAFAAAMMGGVYLYVRGYNANRGTFCEIYCLSDSTVDSYLKGEPSGSWEAVSEDQIHVPLYLDNGLVWDAGPQNSEITAIYPEGRNLLTPRYRMRFSVYNRELGGEQFMYYPLAQRPPTGSDLTVKVVRAGVTYTLSMTVGTGMGESSETIGGMRFFFTGTSVNLRLYDDETAPRQIITPDDTDLMGYNNLEIFADFPEEEAKLERVISMQFCTWFGGAAGGLSGGTRLFLGGNTVEPGLVQWSDLQNPFYFPENNFFLVGDPSQAVTAFGKQSDLLVIFKEREIYCTSYTAGSYSASDVESGATVDLAAQSAVFPLKTLHASIGCDCPGTIQLCLNQLVWADSLGRVFTLCAANAFSERNVRPLSHLIEPRLQAFDRDLMRSATSADWQSHYLLKVGSAVFCLDYGEGFSSIASYADAILAQRGLVWHFWRLPEAYDSASLVPVFGSLCLDSILFYSDETVSAFTYYCAARFLEGEENDGAPEAQSGPVDVASGEIPFAVGAEPVYAELETKRYDLSRPELYKKLSRVYLSVAAPVGNAVKVQLLDEAGPIGCETEFALEEALTDAGGYRLPQTVQILAGPSKSTRVGLRVGAAGLSVGRIQLQMTTLGSVRG